MMETLAQKMLLTVGGSICIIRINLSLHADYSLYEPGVPASVAVHPDVYAGSRYFRVEGMFPASVPSTSLPSLTLTDSQNRQLLIVKLYPASDTVVLSSALNAVRNYK